MTQPLTSYQAATVRLPLPLPPTPTLTPTPTLPLPLPLTPTPTLPLPPPLTLPLIPNQLATVRYAERRALEASARWFEAAL